MILKLFRVSILLTGLSLCSPAQALDEAQVPPDKRTTAGLYLTAREASAFMESNGRYALFLDIRDPHELQTTGMANPVDYNIPFQFINTTRWDNEKQRFQFDPNPHFVRDVTAKYKARVLKGLDAIVLICTSGTRAAAAANALAEAGFRNVQTVVDGYTGWQSSDLKWSGKLDRAKMYGKVAGGK